MEDTKRVRGVTLVSRSSSYCKVKYSYRSIFREMAITNDLASRKGDMT